MKLTLDEYCEEIKRAVRDDERWPELGVLKWLIEHSRQESDQVIVIDSKQGAFSKDETGDHDGNRKRD